MRPFPILGRRRLSIAVSAEVQQALAHNVPVVSLESTIITHGLPFPQNLEMARRVERTIRAQGAVPATCAFVKGKPHVGLDETQLAVLADPAARANKVSRRDIGYAMATGQNGGTTIASTMIMSHRAGIRVFATGGLGGVHRGAQHTMDVSADLTELGRTPVAVVCAGPKLILDIGLTLEYLETQGVFVGTYSEGPGPANVPGFYTRDSGFESPYTFASFAEAARIIHNQNEVMQLQSGSLFCIPPSAATAMASEVIDRVIADAQAEATAKGVRGKALTPFLLARIASVTAGRSVASNVELVLNNAVAAAQIATELAKYAEVTPTPPSSVRHVVPPAPEIVNTLVIGSLALDSIGKSAAPVELRDSNPGIIATSVGGVGFNVARACALALESPSCAPARGAPSSRLVSVVADDLSGRTVLAQLAANGCDPSGVLIDRLGLATAQYSAVHSDAGELVVACADMRIIEGEHSDAFARHIVRQVDRGQPRQILVDCNLSARCLGAVLRHVAQLTASIDVVVEPTSAAKATRLAAAVVAAGARPFPHNAVLAITPTVAELAAIAASFDASGLFEDFDGWFALLESLGIDSRFRERLAGSRHRVLARGLQAGYLQQAFQVLPYVPFIALKLGAEGVLTLTLSTSIERYRSLPTTSPHLPQFTITSAGRRHADGQMGVAIQYWPVPHPLPLIENVTGAGDSFAGYLMARLLASNDALAEATWLGAEIASVEQEWYKWESIYKAQVAAAKSLGSCGAVSEQIKEID